MTDHFSVTPGAVTPDELETRIKKTEEEKQLKQAERRRKAIAKERNAKRQRMERLIAPIILVLTILLGIFVQLLYR